MFLKYLKDSFLNLLAPGEGLFLFEFSPTAFFPSCLRVAACYFSCLIVFGFLGSHVFPAILKSLNVGWQKIFWGVSCFAAIGLILPLFLGDVLGNGLLFALVVSYSLWPLLMQLKINDLFISCNWSSKSYCNIGSSQGT